MGIQHCHVLAADEHRDIGQMVHGIEAETKPTGVTGPVMWKGNRRNKIQGYTTMFGTHEESIHQPVHFDALADATDVAEII